MAGEKMDRRLAAILSADVVGYSRLMGMDDAVKNMILKTSDANAIKQKALEQGMTTLRQAGAQKVLEGVTTIEEVFRVTQQ